MPRELKVLIACGSGIATSTVAEESVKQILAEAGISAKTFKATVPEIQAKQNEMDIICVTANYTKPVSVPLIKVFGLISGIGEEQIKAQLIEACHHVLEEN
ncbi:MAG: PTS sugar transporter subunit IIB [Oscillospiraceae bacterium]|nr:PTS sugar transporter subunit IIB [Oscillospiraceae bacterium]